MVYVLTCGEADFYAEMTAVSAALLRRLYPSAHVHLLVDELTDSVVQRRRPLILDLCNDYHVVTTGMTSPRERAWSMKSRMRQIVQGDFLFLDADALPIRPFHEVFQTPCDFAGVLDRHDPPRRYVPMGAEQEIYARLGWRFPRHYYNSGVLLFRDTAMAHRLGEEWERRWKMVRDQGRLEDQFSFNSAVADLPLRAATLPAKYNAQIMMRRSAARGAAIVHTFTVGFGEDADTVLGRLVSRLKRTGEMDTAELERFQRTGYPWTKEDWIGGQVAVGNYREAIAIVGRRIVKRLRREAVPLG